MRGLRKAVILSVEVVDKKKMTYFTEKQLTTITKLLNDTMDLLF